MIGGLGRGPLDPVERDLFGNSLQALGDSLEIIKALAAASEAALAAPSPITVGDLSRTADVLAITPLPSGLDRSAVTTALWSDPAAIERTVSAGRAYRAAWDAAAPAFTQEGANVDYMSVRSAIAAKGLSLFRFLAGGYRAAIRDLRGHVAGALPKESDAQLALIDQMTAAQAAQKAFRAVEETGAAFGKQWQGEQSDWDALNAVLAWRARHMTISAATWALLASATDVKPLKTLRIEFDHAHADIEQRLSDVVADLQLDLRRAFGVTKSAQIALTDLNTRLTIWLIDLGGVDKFTHPQPD